MHTQLCELISLHLGLLYLATGSNMRGSPAETVGPPNDFGNEGPTSERSSLCQLELQSVQNGALRELYEPDPA